MNVYFVGAPTMAKGIADFNTLAQDFNEETFYWFCHNASEKLQKLYPNINFITGLSDEDLREIINKKMDLFVSCSHFEGFCLPIAEAMLMLKPVVAYDLAEVHSCFLENIQYIPCFDLAKYSETLRKILSDNKDVNSLKQAKNYIKKSFFPDVVARRLISIVSGSNL